MCAKERMASGSAGQSRIGGLIITYSKRVTEGQLHPKAGGAVVAGIGWKLGRGVTGCYNTLLSIAQVTAATPPAPSSGTAG